MIGRRCQSSVSLFRGSIRKTFDETSELLSSFDDAMRKFFAEESFQLLCCGDEEERKWRVADYLAILDRIHSQSLSYAQRST